MENNTLDMLKDEPKPTEVLPQGGINCAAGKVRALELGFTNKQIGNGSQLNKFLRNKLTPVFSQTINYIENNFYEVNDELDTCINSFYGTI